MARGSVRPRPSSDGKRTVYRVKWETRGPDGKRQYHSATRHTKKEADALLTEKQKEVNDGTHVVPSKETVAVYLERWLAASAPAWAPSSLGRYQSTVRSRILPYIGAIPLAQLDAAQVQALYSALAARYAAHTVRGTHSVLNSALSRAVQWRLIPHNPADNAILPSVPRAAPKVWNAEESAAFLAATVDDRYHALWRLALDSGMRIGEILALSWRDVDLDHRTVAVRRTLTRAGKSTVHISEIPKTKAGSRSIIIGAVTASELRTYRAQQSERRLRLGPAWHDLGLVFDRGDGEPTRPGRVADSFQRILLDHPELPRLTLHGMRHTTATLLLAAGVNPKIVQERLGHASVQMTLDRYSHVTLSMQDSAATLLDAVLSGEARPKRGQETG